MTLESDNTSEVDSSQRAVVHNPGKSEKKKKNDKSKSNL